MQLNYNYLALSRRASIPMERVYNQVREAIKDAQEKKSSAMDVRTCILDALDTQESGMEDRKGKIVENLTRMIDEEDVIITFGESERITRAFIEAASNGRKFSVIVIGTRPKTTNENMLRKLVTNGVPCTLAPLNALPFLMETTTKAIVSASQVLANGSVIADIGTVGHE